MELSYALEFASKNKNLSHHVKNLSSNSLSSQKKECAICDIISHYRKLNG